MRLYGRWHKGHRRYGNAAYAPRVVMLMGEPIGFGRVILPPRGAALREGRVAGSSRPKVQQPRLMLTSRRQKRGAVVLSYDWVPAITLPKMPKPHSIGATVTKGKLAATILDYERYWRTPGNRVPRHKPKRYQWANWRMSQGALGGAWRPSQLRKPDRRGR